MELSSRERLNLVLHGDRADVIPFSPNLAYLFDTLPSNLRALGHLGLCRLLGADLLNRFAPAAVKYDYGEKIGLVRTEKPDFIHDCLSTPVGRLEKLWRKSEGGNTFFLVEHPLKTEEDYKTFLYLLEHITPIPDPGPARECLAADPDGLHIGMLIPEHQKSAFQSLVEHWAGTGEIFFHQLDFPDTFEAVYTAMRELHRRTVELSLEADYEFFLTWEDSSTQNYSPQFYRQYIAPEITEWCDILKTAGKKYIQHACGHSRELLPMMRDSGVHAVESLATYPTGNQHLAEARTALGREVGIIGGIDPVELLTRDCDSLLAYAGQVIEEGRGGPFILSNSDSCPHGVTLEKLQHLAELAHATPY